MAGRCRARRYSEKAIAAAVWLGAVEQAGQDAPAQVRLVHLAAGQIDARSGSGPPAR